MFYSDIHFGFLINTKTYTYQEEHFSQVHYQMVLWLDRRRYMYNVISKQITEEMTDTKR